MDDTGHGPTPPSDRAFEPEASRPDAGESHSPAADAWPMAAPRRERPAHPPEAVLSLKQAMRRARFDDAERSSVVSDLRAARLGRLDVLHDALKPLVAQIPADVDCFDIGIMPGANPRLFIDMIGFIEMARDPRVYRFLQDTRHGRVKLAESESVAVIVEAATLYVARRLLERDKALASDSLDGPAAAKTARPAGKPPAGSTDKPPAGPTGKPQLTSKPQVQAAAARRSPERVLGMIFAFVIDVLGSVAFFSILAFAGWVIWSTYKQ